jgi:hypothetical protein
VGHTLLQKVTPITVLAGRRQIQPMRPLSLLFFD